MNIYHSFEAKQKRHENNQIEKVQKSIQTVQFYVHLYILQQYLVQLNYSCFFFFRNTSCANRGRDKRNDC